MVLSRAFFLPGELPAMTHLGCTLFRHCFHSALRYGRYHLALSVPEVVQVCLVHLRPYFEGCVDDAVDDLILNPGGDSAPDLPLRAGAAMSFHRMRLALRPRVLEPRPVAAQGAGSDPWDRFRNRVSAWIPVLGDALLADLTAVRRRRRQRSRGGPVPPCSSPRARILAGADSLPPPDVGGAATDKVTFDGPLPPPDPHRGSFRDTWLAAAGDLRLAALALGENAHRSGLVREPEDVFFLPFDHLDVLAGERAPAWLAPTIEANRAEWAALEGSEAPPERLESRDVGVRWRTRDQLPSAPLALASLA